MIYPGLRCSRYYMRQLERVRSFKPHNLVSVAGGGAFLHAISRKTHRIVIIDKDAEALEFCRELVQLIKNTLTLEEFRFIIESRYKDQPNIHMTGHHLAPGQFSWYFGQWAFATEVTYKILRSTLQQRPIEFRLGDVYEQKYPTNRSLVILASNTDSPLFNGNNILKERPHCQVTLITWLGVSTWNPNRTNKKYEGYEDV